MGRNGNGEVIKYHIFIYVVVIELSDICLNTGPEDRLTQAKRESVKTREHINSPARDLESGLFPMFIESGWTAMMYFIHYNPPTHWERSASVVECLTRDRGATGSSLTSVTALWSLSKTHLA